MIDGNKLMLGNLFKEKFTGQTIEVIGIEGNKITFSGTFKDKWQAKPILLTEEILLKFGFNKTSMYKNTYNYHIKTLNGFHDIFIDISANVLLIGAIELGSFFYLHQLQNLLTSLGHHLTITI